MIISFPESSFLPSSPISRISVRIISVSNVLLSIVGDGDGDFRPPDAGHASVGDLDVVPVPGVDVGDAWGGGKEMADLSGLSVPAL